MTCALELLLAPAPGNTVMMTAGDPSLDLPLVTDTSLEGRPVAARIACLMSLNAVAFTTVTGTHNVLP
jgi:hypothetical protein